VLGISRQGRKQGLDGGVITESLAAMGEPVDVTGSKNKAAAQLERISSEFVLRVPRSFGAGAGLGIVSSQPVKQVAAFKLHRSIRFAFFINEQGEGDTRFVAKSACIDAVPKSHCGQVRSAGSEDLFVRAQLRDVLTAEDSPIMAQEDYHCRLVNPQRTKAEFPAVYIRQANHGKAAIESGVHGLHCEWAWLRVKQTATWTWCGWFGAMDGNAKSSRSGQIRPQGADGFHSQSSRQLDAMKGSR
jgi:hypothetical protein